MLEYETANPGQDFDDKEEEFFDPSKDTSRPIVNMVPDGSAYMTDGRKPVTTVPHPDCLASHSRHSPGPELQTQGSAIRDGRAEIASDSRRRQVSEGMPQSEIQYVMAPDVEAAKATQRETGRV